MRDPIPQRAPCAQTPTDLSSKERCAAAIAAACIIAAPFTAGFEGLRPHPYRDATGTPTVCYGDTQVEMRVYAADECGKLLRERMARDYAPKVLACLPQLLEERRKPVFAALIDASYNAGPAAVCKSRMAVSIRASQWRAACSGISGWYVTSKGVPLRGLVRRRDAEKALCLQGAA